MIQGDIGEAGPTGAIGPRGLKVCVLYSLYSTAIRAALLQWFFVTFTFIFPLLAFFVNKKVRENLQFIVFFFRENRVNAEFKVHR